MDTFFPRRACGRMATLAVSTAGLLLVVSRNAPAQPPQAVPVAVARVERQELAVGQSFVGTVYPARVSDVGSAVDGRVVKLPVLEGEHVAAGQPIAELLRGLLEIEKAGAVA